MRYAAELAQQDLIDELPRCWQGQDDTTGMLSRRDNLTAKLCGQHKCLQHVSRDCSASASVR